MFNTLRMFGGLFTATLIFLTGQGLLNTLIGTRMAVEGFRTTTTGTVLSFYFVGLLTGSLVCHRLILRIGHIRSFTVFAAAATAAALLYSLLVVPWFWCLLRFASGVATFGMFMVIESWLNECCEPQVRGRVFSVYMSLVYLGNGMGQQLLNIGSIEGRELFILVGIVFSLCLVPVATTEGIHPSLPETKPNRFLSILRKAPLAMLGCLAAGLVNSTIFAMTPVVCTAMGLSLRQLSWVMTLTVFSGLAAQWLVGSLSDRFDRLKVLSVFAAAIAVCSVAAFVKGGASFPEMAVGMSVIGALAFAVYPLSVARAHDIFGGRDAVAVSASLLFSFSVGASISPLLASTVITLLDTPFGLFAYWAANAGLLAVVTIYFRKYEKVDVVPVEEQVSFVPMKKTSPVVMVLDPRAERDDTTQD